MLYNFLLKKEEVDLDFDPEDALPMSPGYSKSSLKSDAEATSQYGKKEEINYDWTQGMFADYKPGLENTSNKLQIFMGILEVSSTSTHCQLLTI